MTGLLLVATAWVLFKKDPSSVSINSTASSEKKSEKKSEEKQEEKSSEVLTPVPTTSAQVKKERLNPSLQAELRELQIIKAKPFPTAAEQEKKKSLLKNSEFLRSLGETLRNVHLMQDPQYETSENAALDFLMEALQSGDQKTALEVSKQLIQDPQVENDKLPQELREILAGIKGEILYHATSIAPSSLGPIESLLPGPVSQRIWENVQNEQRSNLAESQRELASRNQR
ncbi:MAG: hypothetical protein ACAH59_07185 [Pseudobdellovibrionaceae bacterium]